jgi:hypothetical protein
MKDDPPDQDYMLAPIPKAQAPNKARADAAYAGGTLFGIDCQYVRRLINVGANKTFVENFITYLIAFNAKLKKARKTE